MKHISISNWMLGALAISAALTLASCEDEPDKFKLTDGTPTIKYIRPAGASQGDNLIESAFLDNTICLVGDNLTSIKEMYFNDKKAILNTSFITDHTLIVTIPGAIPEVVTNKIYMVCASNDTVTYDFAVNVPAPSVRSISCEWAAPGTVVTLLGDYFIDDPNISLEISFAGNVNVPAENIKSITKTAITFEVPENWTEGYMNVTSLYGTGRSAFKFHDTTNILFDWDGTRGGHATAHGWRNGVIHTPGTDAGVEAIDGSYLYFAGDMSGNIGGTWNEDAFCFNYWPDESGEFGPLSDRKDFAKLITNYGVENLQIKFEMYIPSSNPWQASAMQIMFSGNDNVTSSTGNNSYYMDMNLPRGLYMPWKSTGSYDTADEWVTVTMPLNTFTYCHDGSTCGSSLKASQLTGLSFFVWYGGVQGSDCSPVILIDNIRVVPIEL